MESKGYCILTIDIGKYGFSFPHSSICKNISREKNWCSLYLVCILRYPSSTKETTSVHIERVPSCKLIWRTSQFVERTNQVRCPTAKQNLRTIRELCVAEHHNSSKKKIIEQNIKTEKNQNNGQRPAPLLLLLLLTLLSSLFWPSKHLFPSQYTKWFSF